MMERSFSAVNVRNDQGGQMFYRVSFAGMWLCGVVVIALVFISSLTTFQMWSAVAVFSMGMVGLFASPRDTVMRQPMRGNWFILLFTPIIIGCTLTFYHLAPTIQIRSVKGFLLFFLLIAPIMMVVMTAREKRPQGWTIRLPFNPAWVWLSAAAASLSFFVFPSIPLLYNFLLSITYLLGLLVFEGPRPSPRS